MGQTVNHQFPYPELASPADVPFDIKKLADALDATIPVVPVIPPGGGGFTNIPVLEVGQNGQNRAGRQLAPADFTMLGLAAPLGLWNLGSTADASGNGRTLNNKGAVPFGVGINGQAATAAVFAGSTAQALYFDDQGTNDPLRLRTGSWGCWFRVAKRGVQQMIFSKASGAAAIGVWAIQLSATNLAFAQAFSDGSSAAGSTTTTDVCDDRWHFIVGTHDGTRIRSYIDGALEASAAAPFLMFSGSAPVNVGGWQADGSTATGLPFYGRVDEAFVTADVLTDDQVRLLYCTRLAHALGAIPGDVRIAVHRKRRGAPLTTTDFPSAPVRLHNFTAGALTDQGSGNVPLTNNGGAVSVVGADGVAGGAYNFVAGSSQSLSSTDAGLPSGTSPVSFGAWFKLSSVAGQAAANIISYGTPASVQRTLQLTNAALIQYADSGLTVGPYAGDGVWHHVVVVCDNTAGDGVKVKIYLDGRLVAGNTVLGSVVLGGTMRIGARADNAGSNFFNGQIDGAFVHPAALTADQIATLYNKSGQDLAASTKDPGDHFERVDGNSLLATFDTVDPQNTIDLGVAA